MTVFAVTAFVVLLVGAVVLHEYGHLLTAKAFGMRADRFFVGFGPTLFSRRRGETEYGLKAFPLGGFVAIRGMGGADDERRLPLADEIFAPTALAKDREQAATRTSTAASDQPNLTDETFVRLESVLRTRGTSKATTERIVRRVRTNLPDAATAADARRLLAEVLATEVGESERVGDLAHRLARGDEGRFYVDRPAWQRAIVVGSGPVTHLVIAFAVLVVAYVFVPQPTGELTTEVGGILEDSAAETAGLQAGDQLRAVDGVTSNDFMELREVIRERPDEPTQVVVERDGDRLSIELTPEALTDEETGETVGLAGFEPGLETARMTPFNAARRAALGDEIAPVGGVIPMIGASFEGLVTIFSPEGLTDLVSQATGQTERNVEGAVSIVGAASIAGQTAEAGASGLLAFLTLLAFINVFFFLFNMVPLPPFDGGHLVVLAIERSVNVVKKLRGKKPDFTVDPRAIVAVTLPVLLILAVVLVSTLWLDVSDPIRLG